MSWIEYVKKFMKLNNGIRKDWYGKWWSVVENLSQSERGNDHRRHQKTEHVRTESGSRRYETGNYKRRGTYREDDKKNVRNSRNDLRSTRCNVSMFPVSIFPVSMFPVSMFPVSMFPVSMYPCHASHCLF